MSRSAPSFPLLGRAQNLVPIKAKGDAKKKLKKKGKATVNPTFTSTPTGGTASTQTKQIKLKKQKNQ